MHDGSRENNCPLLLTHTHEKVRKKRRSNPERNMERYIMLLVPLNIKPLSEIRDYGTMERKFTNFALYKLLYKLLYKFSYFSYISFVPSFRLKSYPSHIEISSGTQK